MNYNQQIEMKQLYETFPQLSHIVIHEYYIQFKGNMDIIVDKILLLIDEYTIKDHLLSNESSDVTVQTFIPSTQSSNVYNKNKIESTNKKKM